MIYMDFPSLALVQFIDITCWDLASVWYQAVITWIKTPSIAASDCTMIAMCLKVAGMISLSEELTWQLIDSFGIIEFLEDGGNSISSTYMWLYCTGG